MVIDEELPQALPSKSTGPSIPNLPEITHPVVTQVAEENKSLFSQHTGRTDITHHLIDTGDALPVKVSPCPIPFYYVGKVQNQFTDTVNEGIIRPSSSP